MPFRIDACQSPGFSIASAAPATSQGIAGFHIATPSWFAFQSPLSIRARHTSPANARARSPGSSTLSSLPRSHDAMSPLSAPSQHSVVDRHCRIGSSFDRYMCMLRIQSAEEPWGTCATNARVIASHPKMGTLHATLQAGTSIYPCGTARELASDEDLAGASTRDDAGPRRTDPRKTPTETTQFASKASQVQIGGAPCRLPAEGWIEVRLREI